MNEYGDLRYSAMAQSLFCDGSVCWLNRGAILAKVYSFGNEIATFLENNNITFTEFRDPEWVLKLEFLMDLTIHVNKLSKQLQGRN